MTSNRPAVIDTDKPVSSKPRAAVAAAADDEITQSYQTSGMSRPLVRIHARVFAEVIGMMNRPTHVRCINTPNGSVAGDTSTSSACELLTVPQTAAHVHSLRLVNLDRGRGELENDIRKLLTDIRERRTRLVHENSQSIAYAPTSRDAPPAMT